MLETPEKTLAIEEIENGTVLDHITVGQALKIISLLGLDTHDNTVTIGLNLPCDSMERKDIIKVENKKLTPEEANQVSLLAPYATINIIQDYDVVEKYKVTLPETISSVIICPNSKCVTNYENAHRLFYIKKRRQPISLQCRFCRKIFTRDEIKIVKDIL